jgi:hypothetical protein
MAKARQLQIPTGTAALLLVSATMLLSLDVTTAVGSNRQSSGQRQAPVATAMPLSDASIDQGMHWADFKWICHAKSAQRE